MTLKKNKPYTQGKLLSILVLCAYVGERFKIYFLFLFTQVFFILYSYLPILPQV